MDEAALLTATEVAERLGISKWRLYRRIHRGDLQALVSRSGSSQFLITEQAVQEFIDAGGVDPPPQPATNTTDRDWISTTEAATLTGFSTETIRRLCRTGQIPHMRGTGPRGHLRISRSGLLNHID